MSVSGIDTALFKVGTLENDMEYRIKKILTFIRSHGVDCYYSASGKLMVENVSYSAFGTHRNWIEIKPTGKAAKEFLNY